MSMKKIFFTGPMIFVCSLGPVLWDRGVRMFDLIHAYSLLSYGNVRPGAWLFPHEKMKCFNLKVTELSQAVHLSSVLISEFLCLLKQDTCDSTFTRNVIVSVSAGT